MIAKIPSSLRRSLLLVFVVALLLAGTSSVMTGQTEAHQKKLLEEEQHNSKISNSLELLASTANSEGTTAARQHASRMGIDVNNSNAVTTIIEKKRGGFITQAEVSKFGGEILRETDNLIEIRLPVTQIRPIVNEVDGIEYLRTPHNPVSLSKVEYGPYFSTGVNLTGGGLFHSKNLLGREVKIAVIDVGFGSFNYASEDGEFPAEFIAEKKDYTAKQAGDFYDGGPHGTAVAEIVHDMAPLADLYLKRIDNEVSLQEATNDAISQEIDIIVHSVGWFNTNFGDGTGVIAETAKQASNNGILWVNAAGNSARRHWEGKAQDPDNDNWVEFSDGSETISIDVKNSLLDIALYLTWNDWPKSDKNFKLYLYDEDWELKKRSIGYGELDERLVLDSKNIDEGRYHLRLVAPEEGSDTEVEIFSLNHRLDPFVKKSSIMAPGNVEEVLTVGTINKRNWQEGLIANYSSRGPTEKGKIKPDLTGVDGVRTYVYEDFLGTSAAAPHAAGAAALILSREPTLGTQETVKALKNNTKDLGSEGPNDTYGWGKMRLIYKTPSATRSFQVEKEGKNGPEPGDKITVAVEARMPLTLQGGMNLNEEVPEPLEVLKIANPASGTVSGQSISAKWPTVEPGETKELKYEALIPTDISPGKYEFTGLVNGNSIGGTENTTILEVNNADSGRDEDLDLEEVQTEKESFTNQLKIQANGENIEEIKVKVFSDTGREVFDSGWQTGPSYQWGIYNNQGERIANGVYLYYVQVKGPNGEIEQSDILKYLVLR